VAGHPSYKVLVVQKSDIWPHRGLLGNEKKKKKIAKIQHRLGMNFKTVSKYNFLATNFIKLFYAFFLDCFEVHS
jgi:hypothetical protein